MVDLGIYNYIQASLAEGKTEEAIRAELAQSAADPKACEVAWDTIKNHKSPVASSGLAFDSLIGFIIVVVVGAAIASYIFLPNLHKSLNASFSSMIPVSMGVPSGVHAGESEFNREQDITTDVDNAMAAALNYQDSNGGSYGNDVDTSCQKAIQGLSVFDQPVLKSSLQDVMAAGSASQECRIYAGGISMAISVQLVVDNSKWYCRDSDGNGGVTIGNPLAGGTDGCATPGQ